MEECSIFAALKAKNVLENMRTLPPRRRGLDAALIEIKFAPSFAAKNLEITCNLVLCVSHHHFRAYSKPSALSSCVAPIKSWREFFSQQQSMSHTRAGSVRFSRVLRGSSFISARTPARGRTRRFILDYLVTRLRSGAANRRESPIHQPPTDAAAKGN